MAGQEDCSIIDVGGQDTKYILVQDGRAVDFLMNDKCAAGTGKFTSYGKSSWTYNRRTIRGG